jgi:hypothetical protein
VSTLESLTKLSYYFLTNVAFAIVLFLLKCICYIVVKGNHDIRRVTERKRKMAKNNRYHKEGGIRIVDPRRVDYTYTDDHGMFDIKSPSDDGKYKDGSKNQRQKKIPSNYDMILQ